MRKKNVRYLKFEATPQASSFWKAEKPPLLPIRSRHVSLSRFLDTPQANSLSNSDT